ncbi:MAG TPA: agmatine deiminase family protein [Candidatus Thermoplasmatota archaeon]|nr:agmatine deiminase family protein [Candidatus Thermoplasmatota archaeon]
MVLSFRGPVPTPRELGFRMPAEWEPQESVWFVWPRDPLTWPDRVEVARDVFVEAMRLVTPHQKVDLVVHPDLAGDCRDRLAKEGIRNVRLHAVDHQDSWIRDYGPIYLVRDGAAGKGRERVASRFRFNAWGNKYEALLKDAGVVDRLGEAVRAPLADVEMVLEGGSVDVDGQGTVLTTEQCLLHPNRNPDLDRAAIELHLLEYLGAQKVLWLGHGIEGDDTDGHVDDITRFVAPGVVATAVEADPAHPNHAVLQDNLLRLQRMQDARGRRLQVIEVPMPKDIVADEGRPLPASHLNFLITDGCVLLPTFGGPSDLVAQQRLQAAFDRPVVPLPCEDLVWGMGAIHCLSQQVPVGRPVVDPW